MVTDIIGDFIIRIKNGNLAGKETVSMYTSRNKEAMADALMRAGFIKSFSKNSTGKMLELVLSYKSDKMPKITGVQRVSKPSRRVYVQSKNMRPFKSNFGISIFSTPKGIMTSRSAKKEGIGGEHLFNIW